MFPDEVKHGGGGNIIEKQAQLRLCKLGPGTVLIFYMSLARTPMYM